ncbi:MAG: hypothetical protein AAGD25_01115 [Cyanobacteria bacterium P01_F01_bin.150]
MKGYVFDIYHHHLEEMLPFNDSISPNSPPRSIGNQQAYRELIHHLSQFFSEETLTERLNIEQMFILVDGVLPIEACLYYQVLPLFLDGSRLHLGMVNPEDNTASDYVRRIVSYLNYSLLTRRISSQALQAALSAYLKYSDSQSTAAQRQVAVSKAPPAQTHQNDSQPEYKSIPHNLETNSRETLVLDATEQVDISDMVSNTQGAESQRTDYPEMDNAPILPADELTCIDPEKTDILQLDTTDDDVVTQLLTPEELSDTSSELTTEGAVVVTPPLSPLSYDSQASHSNYTNSQASHSPSMETSGPDSQSLPSTPGGEPPLSMQVQAEHGGESIDALEMLAPRELLKELLARAMSGGIGRLYFERKAEYGRILWSQSGVLQAAVDHVVPVKFQALINEFKRLTRLPLLPLNNTKQVELERFYKGKRVLLRFRFIPGKYGEQATLQVLRGAALNFYQQQQVARIGQDAVSTAKRLQTKISTLKARLDAYPRLSNPEQASLPELKQMLLNIEKQVDDLNGAMLESPEDIIASNE